MHRFLVALLCAASVFAIISSGQVVNSSSHTALTQPMVPAIEPLKVQAGTVLTFHLQTRLRPVADDPLDALPQGTTLHVKMLRAIDSTVDRDGSEFHGWVASDLALGDGVIIHAESEVRGLLVLLRSKNHPEGFRYELLLTELSDHGKSYPLTASLSSSFFDASPQPAATKVATKDSSKSNGPSNTRIPVDTHQ